MDLADFHSFLMLFVSSPEGIRTLSRVCALRVATSESFAHLDLCLESSLGLVAQLMDGLTGHPMFDKKSRRSLLEMSP